MEKIGIIYSNIKYSWHNEKVALKWWLKEVRMFYMDLLSIVRKITTGQENFGLIIILMIIMIVILMIYTISKNSA